MVANKSSNVSKQQELTEEIHGDIVHIDNLKSLKLDSSEKSKKAKSLLDKMMNEREEQRREMLKYVRQLTSGSFLLLAFVVIFQGITRLFISNYELISPTVFNILAISVFGQVIGVILVIVKSLWDDSKYLEKM